MPMIRRTITQEGHFRRQTVPHVMFVPHDELRPGDVIVPFEELTEKQRQSLIDGTDEYTEKGLKAKFSKIPSGLSKEQEAEIEGAAASRAGSLFTRFLRGSADERVEIVNGEANEALLEQLHELETASGRPAKSVIAALAAKGIGEADEDEDEDDGDLEEAEVEDVTT